ncbi:MAG TPA: DUF4382 domain-containing protein [Candidatus Hydrogenedentes bacterium]|nr:DUF4382 domain-containing protein [Candidatus Hydrogenedentota bacterium]
MDGMAGSYKGIRGVFAPGLMILLMVVLAGGCPQPNGPAKLVIVMGSGELSAGENQKDAIDLSEIDTLYVSIHKVTLDYVGLDNLTEGDVASDEGMSSEEGDLSSEEDQTTLGSLGQITVFEGDLRMDIRDLSSVSEILSTVDVEPGYYTKIRLSIGEPELRLASAPDVAIMDIHLTANARLFVSETFNLPDGQTSILTLDFQDLHLVETGHGGYVWTPQLRADVHVEAVEGE